MNGFIKLPAGVVVAACEAYLADFKARVDKEREPLIQQAMKPGLIFHRSGRTREQAIAHLRNADRMWSAWEIAGMRGGYWRSQVSELLTSARLVSAGQLISVSSSMSECIAKHVPSGAPSFDGVAQALNAAVCAIYFDDSADYIRALWSVVRALSPTVHEVLQRDPAAAYDITEQLVNSPAPVSPDNKGEAV